MAVNPSQLFRPQAWEHLHAARPSEGEPLRPVPRGLEQTYRVLVLIGLALVLFALVARVGEYVTGTGIVRSTARQAVVATRAGTVAEVPVHIGASVPLGGLIVRFASLDEEATLEGLTATRDAAMARYLSAPRSPGLREALIEVNGDMRAADARLLQSRVLSPVAGTLTDLRVHAGQLVSPGDVIAFIESGGSTLALDAALPGSARPLLAPGQLLRVEPAGFSDVVITAPIDAVAGQVIGVAEAERALGASAAGALALVGPQVFVTAALPASVRSHGHDVGLHDGMVVKVHVQIRRERVIEALLPWLKDLGT